MTTPLMEDHIFNTINQCAQIIKDLGFPIFVAVWCLIVQRKTTERLTDAIKALTSAFTSANIHIHHTTKGGD